MLKKIGITTMAVAGVLAFAGTRKAEAATRFGVYVGAPAPVYSVPADPYYPYGYPYAYADPYYYPPVYGPTYVAPGIGLGFGGGGWGHDHDRFRGGDFHGGARGFVRGGGGHGFEGGHGGGHGRR